MDAQAGPFNFFIHIPRLQGSATIVTFQSSNVGQQTVQVLLDRVKNRIARKPAEYGSLLDAVEVRFEDNSESIEFESDASLELLSFQLSPNGKVRKDAKTWPQIWAMMGAETPARGPAGEDGVTTSDPTDELPYFISPQVQAVVEQSVFYILEDDSVQKGVGVGVFYKPQKAVSADHNLTRDQVVGSVIKAVIPATKEELDLRIDYRDADLDFAILSCELPHVHVPPLAAGAASKLRGVDLVLASFRIGIEEDAPMFSRRLGFTKATTIVLSEHERHLFYHCFTFAGDSGAALIVENGRLVGIHQEGINQLRARLEREEVEDHLKEVEGSVDQILRGGLSQGSMALLVHTFSDI